jgi:hypothetical protein
MAWTNNVLRINLTDGSVSNEPLNMEWARLYLGQRGLATKYLAEEIDPMCDALSPENKLIMTTGPLTGTMASTAGRYSVVTKSPLTGAVACSNSGGFIGSELKSAGYDMVIFEGKAPQPVYIYIENDKVEILSADEIWGKSVWAADEWLHKKIPGSVVAYCRRRPQRREWLPVLGNRERPASRCRPFRRRHGHGVQEHQGSRGQGHQGCRQHQGPGRIHAGGECRQESPG